MYILVISVIKKVLYYFFIKIILIITAQNFSYEYLQPGEYEIPFGNPLGNGSWNGKIGQILRNVSFTSINLS